MATAGLEDTKVRVLEAAGRIFAERGFRNATVRDICQAAHVNLAAVNYHFGDKERLYIESVKLAHRMRMQQVPMPDWPEGTPAAVKLHGFVYAFLCRVLADDGQGWESQLMMRELAQPTAACEELVREYIRPHFALLQRIIDDLVAPTTDEAERHRIGFSIVGQCLHYRIAEPIVRLLISPEEYKQNDPLRLADHISRWTLAALGAGPTLGCSLALSASSSAAPSAPEAGA
ncbi:MAG: CerR family C-terminal domain-containing protein [Planctomycetia bacterium]|nr:CerR family C-terminal domain-containing protein [Planctomycetia bacterium]